MQSNPGSPDFNRRQRPSVPRTCLAFSDHCVSDDVLLGSQASAAVAAAQAGQTGRGCTAASTQVRRQRLRQRRRQAGRWLSATLEVYSIGYLDPLFLYSWLW